jgi:hypothetical protein
VRARIAVVLAALAAPRAFAAAPCEVRVSVEPANAWVGEQIAYRLQILRDASVQKVRFADDLSFPSFRSEWLPGQTLDPALRAAGDLRLVVEERRALFPVRAGTIEIPGARLECLTARGAAEVDVPGASVAVRELPASESATRLVGRVDASARLARGAIALGESVRLMVFLRGEANLWEAASPLDGAALPEHLDVHAHEPETARIPGRRLVLERGFAYDLVPRRSGTYAIPALRVAWLDPASGRTQIEQTAPLVLAVVEPAAASASPPDAPAERAKARAERRVPLGAVAAFLAALAGAALGLRHRKRATPPRAAAPHLAEAKAAASRGDRAAERAALAAALRDALALRMPEARTLAAEELAALAEGPARDAAAALVELDRARFAADDGTLRLDAERVRNLVEAL